MEVVTSSGQEYTGDLVVGADGVHSVIRSEMWKLADALEPGRVSKREKRSKPCAVCLDGFLETSN